VTSDGLFTFGGTNDLNNTIKFALPVVVGVLGIFEFFITGFLLINYYSRLPEVNMRPIDVIINFR